LHFAARRRMIVTMTRYRFGVKASRRLTLLALGVSSTLVGLILAGSFQFITDHRWYWDLAPLLCLVILLGTVLGGLLVGRSLGRTLNTRLWMVVVGILLGLVWIGTGTLATVLGALGMCHLSIIHGHIGWDTYSSSELFTGAPIRFLQIAAGTGFLGGVVVGLSSAWKRLLAALPLVP
jgi:hypothetical protein